MSDLNRLIATAGGYQPPAFDYATNKRNMLAAQGQKLQNQLLQQQVETQPYKIALEQKAMEVERAALSVKEQALKLAQQGKKDVTLPVSFGGKQYMLEGDSQAITKVMEDTAKFASQALDEQTGELSSEWGQYLASMQISAKEVEPKAPIMGTPEYLKAFEEQEKIKSRYKEPKEKDSQTYLLPNKKTAMSFDGGRTYIAEDGSSRKMPSGAVKITTTFTGPEMAMLRTQQQAQGQITQETGQRDPAVMEQKAISATGPYSMIEAAIDKLLGGFGVDLAVGQEGFFPDTQQNRQMLRAIKQTGKNALMNSARGAIWEQQRIDELFPDPDKFFTNPRTEARKFEVIRDTLIAERTHNTETIVAATDPKVVSDLAKSNVEIDRLLSLIGRPKTQIPQITTNEDFRKLPSGSKFKDPQGNIRMKP